MESELPLGVTNAQVAKKRRAQGLVSTNSGGGPNFFVVSAQKKTSHLKKHLLETVV